MVQIDNSRSRFEIRTLGKGTNIGKSGGSESVLCKMDGTGKKHASTRGEKHALSELLGTEVYGLNFYGGSTRLEVTSLCARVHLPKLQAKFSVVSQK